MNGRLQRRVGKPRTVNGKPARPRVTWTVRVYVDAEHGGPRRESHGSYAKQGEAAAKLVAVLDAYQRGTYRKPSRLTVGQVYELWVASRGPEWAASTRRFHAMNWEHHIRDELAGELAEALPKATVAAWQAGRLKAGCAPKSVAGYRGTLHAMYEWAVSVDLVGTNPVAAVKAPTVDRADHDALTVAEMQAYLEALAGSPRLHLPLLIMAATGLRRGEALALRWSDLDLARGSSARVHHRRGNLTGARKADLVFGPPKTKEGARTVPLPPFALEALKALKLRRQAEHVGTLRPWSDEALVCCAVNGRPIVPNNLTTSLRRFCLRRGLDPVSPHMFRHGVAEAMLSAGERVDVVQALLGHTEAATTLGIYAHVTEVAKGEAGSRYGAMWEPVEPEPDELALRRRRSV